MSDRINTSLACLVGLLAHHGQPVAADRLQHDYAISADELDVPLILRIAQENGLVARSVRLGWRKLVRLGEAFPVMARLKNGRSVVIVGIEEPLPGSDTIPANDEAAAERRPAGRRVIVHDPMADGDGILLLPRATFEKAWSGEVVLVRPAPAADEAAGTAEPRFGLRWFVPEIMAQAGIMRDVALAALALHVLALASPIFFQLVVDKVLLHGSITTLTVLVIGVGLAIVVEGLFKFLREYLLLFATNRIDIRLARKTFDKLMSLPLAFFEQHTAGILTQHMQQTEQIRQFLTGRLFFTLLDATALLVFVPFLWGYSPKLTLLTLGFAGLIALTILLLLGPFRRRLQALYHAEGGRQSLLVETIHGMRTVKSLAIEPQQRKAWERRSARAVEMHFGVGKIGAGADALVHALQTFMTCAIVAVGAFDVFAGTLSVGSLIAIQIMSGRVIQPLVQMVSLLKAYQETALSVRMLGNVMNATSERPGSRGGLRPELDGRITFERVTFHYPGRPIPALAEIDLDLPPGSVIGVMGKSGSGKTTLTRLIQGLYVPDEGVIRFSGHDMREIDLVHLRRNIGVVLQDNFLFRGTVRENIAVTRPGATLEEIARTARLAGADEFIEKLPQGFDTPIEENGSNLSGGQKQRIAIARALLPEPRILIFDEATSALDPESEAIFQENLARIAAGRTVIIVSHRLSTIADADQILVFERGKVASAGSHAELLQSCRIYRHFWLQQNRGAA